MHSYDYGITPAYAGNTGIILAPLTLFQDHPRLRGEHDMNNDDISDTMGSPPLTRGTLSRDIN